MSLQNSVLHKPPISDARLSLAQARGSATEHDSDSDSELGTSTVKPDWNRIETADLQGVYLSAVLSVRFTVHPRLKANKDIIKQGVPLNIFIYNNNRLWYSMLVMA